jgi:tocopherol cyclase
MQNRDPGSAVIERILFLQIKFKNMRLFRPAVFQGNLKSKNYFEGWYYKQVTSDLSQVWSFIPGIALTPEGRYVFIQVIDGTTGHTDWFEYPLDSFSFNKKEMKVRVGNSWFMEDRIHINIDQEGHQYEGEIEFSNRIRFPSTWFSPGIMGWYSFIPFMECKHGIVSVTHRLSGQITRNGKPTDFSGGKGYIEKDWGSSFPESWIWIHSNHFADPSASFTFSVAKIPWLGNYFIGHICFLYLHGRFYRFATYTGSKILSLSFNGDHLMINMEGSGYNLEIKVVPNISGRLKAPVLGKMSRIIKESIDSTVYLKLRGKEGNLIFEDTGQRAGFELMEKILSYFS